MKSRKLKLKMELLYEIEDTSAILTLNRPEKRNALDDNLINSLTDALRRADTDDSLRAVVIKGAGTDFCSGADLSVLQKAASGSILDNLADAESLMELFALIRRIKMPVIAAVHGRALAGGCGLATACDLILATKTAKFGYPEVKIGFVPAMVMAMLRRNVSEKRAFELITLGFEFDAAEAEKFGLVNQTYDEADFETGVKAYTAAYKKVSRSAVMLSKRLLYQTDSLTFDQSLQAGVDTNTMARLTEDCQTGIAKFLKKTSV